jgi:hypothetical protein
MRANFKWDIQKHLRKVHNNTDAEVECLTADQAKETIERYMEKQYAKQRLADTDASSPSTVESQPTSRTSLASILSSRVFPGPSATTRHAARERKYKRSPCHRTSKWQWSIRKHDKYLIRRLTSKRERDEKMRCMCFDFNVTP